MHTLSWCRNFTRRAELWHETFRPSRQFIDEWMKSVEGCWETSLGLGNCYSHFGVAEKNLSKGGKCWLSKDTFQATARYPGLDCRVKNINNWKDLCGERIVKRKARGCDSLCERIVQLFVCWNAMTVVKRALMCVGILLQFATATHVCKHGKRLRMLPLSFRCGAFNYAWRSLEGSRCCVWVS